MATQGAIYNVKRKNYPPGRRPAPFCQQQWLGKIRSMFGIANGHAYLKQAMVDQLGGHNYGWDEENLAYGMFPDGRHMISPVDHVLFQAKRNKKTKGNFN